MTVIMSDEQDGRESGHELRLGSQGGWVRVPDGRWARSWFWMKRVWELFRGDRSLIAIAALATVLNIVAAALIFGVGAALLGGRHHHDPRLVVGLAVAVFSYPSTVVSTYCNVALLRMAQARFNGGHCTVGAGFRAANRRLPQILGWSLLAVVVGFIIHYLVERIPFGGIVLSFLSGVAWSLATMFAVPVLAVEDAGPLTAPKRSLEIFRARWGEGVIGGITVSAATAVASIPGIFLVAAGIAVGGPAGIAIAVIGAMLLALAFTAGRAMNQLYALAIYRDQVLGEPSFGLDSGQLNDFMRLRKRRGPRRRGS
jgi:hypothetical protein